MFSKIADLENIVDGLLLPHRLDKRPSKELLNAELNWSNEVWKVAESLAPFIPEEEQFEKAIRLCKQPIFICGVHRSGTTLIRDLLDGHQELAVLPAEGNYFTTDAGKIKKLPANKQQEMMGTEWIRRLANPINQPPYWLLGRSSPERSPYVRFAREFKTWWRIGDEILNNISFRPLLATMVSYASVNGNINAKSWVDKTPANENFIKKIWREIPGSKIIHIIRNPVDIYISRKKMEPSLNMRTFLRVLQKSFRIAYKQSRLNDNRYLLIRYEELCKSPDIIIERMAGFLEIELKPELFMPTVNGKPSSANSSFKLSMAGHILAASEHEHNEQLRNREYQILSAHIGSLARKLGYPMPRVNAWQALLLRLKYLLN
jgi:hypothetical protein